MEQVAGNTTEGRTGAVIGETIGGRVGAVAAGGAKDTIPTPTVRVMTARPFQGGTRMCWISTPRKRMQKWEWK